MNAHQRRKEARACDRIREEFRAFWQTLLVATPEVLREFGIVTCQWCRDRGWDPFCHACGMEQAQIELVSPQEWVRRMAEEP